LAGRPKKISKGKVIKEPLPASVLIKPANNPARINNPIVVSSIIFGKNTIKMCRFIPQKQEICFL